MASAELLLDELRRVAEVRQPVDLPGMPNGIWSVGNSALRVGVVWYEDKVMATDGMPQLKADVLISSTRIKNPKIFSALGIMATRPPLREAWVPTSPDWLELEMPTAIGNLQLRTGPDADDYFKLASLRGSLGEIHNRQAAQERLANSFVRLHVSGRDSTFGGLQMVNFVPLP